MPLDILVLADLHYPRNPSPELPRHGNLARLLYRKALRKLRHENITPNLVVILGDLLDDPAVPDAQHHLELLAEELMRDGIRVLALPGNHDDPRRVAEIFDCAPGLHVVDGHGFIIFHDEYLANEPYTFLRSEADLALPETVARENPGLPLVALQHAPLWEKTPEKLRLKNSAQALASYEKSGVILSLSGHLHEGHEPVQIGPANCVTLPAFCEPPFVFFHVRLDADAATFNRHQLSLPENIPLADTHCHTAFAQCATTSTFAENRRVSELLGLRTLAFTEHAFQLYFPNPLSWSFKWQHDPAFAESVWRDPSRGRMAAYKRFINARPRDPNLLSGLELDLFDNGKLLLHPDDAGGWNIFLGAMHRIQSAERGMPPARVESLFMRDLHALLSHPIDILAHPFRIFKHYNVAPPVHLYDETARLLAEAQVAAELNFHESPPDPAFYKACLRRGTKISLATDSHALLAVADLHPHLAFLANLGLTPRDFPEILLDPAALPRRCGSHSCLPI